VLLPTVPAWAGWSYSGPSGTPNAFIQAGDMTFALLGEDRSEFLLFHDGDEDWIEFGDYTHRKCN
jgi:hypothetical protein